MGIAANASASVLIKMAVVAPRKFPSFSDPLAALNNVPFWIGLFLYGVAFLLYSFALTKLPLNIVHPILTAGAVASVALLSSLIFKEPFYWNTILGIVFVTIGVVLISFRSLS